MKNLLLVFGLLVTTAGYAQDKGYVGLNFGLSNPLGDYKSTDPESEDAGYAKSGLCYDLSFGYKIGKNFGIAAMIRRQSNKFNEEELQSSIDEFNAIFDPYAHVSIATEPWKVGVYMAGGYGSFQLTDKLSFESRVLIGLMSAKSPELVVTWTTTDPFEPGGTEIQSSENGSAFAFGIGAGLKMNVSERICLLFNLDYISATPEFKDVKYIDETGEVEMFDFDQSITTVNVGLGIGYRL